MTRHRDPFEGRDRSSDKHYRLAFYGALLLVREVAPEHPLPTAYDTVLAEAGMSSADVGADRRAWDGRLADWESGCGEAADAPPLVRLREAAGLDRLSVSLWLACGLADEDSRLPRMTIAMLRGCWRDAHERADARSSVAALTDGGLVQETPDGFLRPAPRLWSLLLSGPPDSFVPADRLVPLDDLVVTALLASRLDAAASWLVAGQGPLLVRGREGSGRQTLVRGLAQRLGLGVLAAGKRLDQETAVLARMLGAVVLVSPTVEHASLSLAGPADPGPGVPCALRLPTRTTVEAASAMTLDVPMPDAGDRLRHWHAALTSAGHPQEVEVLRRLAEAHRMTGGLIRRVAAGAVSEATAVGRTDVRPVDVTRAARAVGRNVPVTLATRLPVSGSWGDIVVAEATLSELRTLERRCRLRERLPGALPATLAGGLGPGVRALFTGPSGTGKTLASRVLAASLGKDLYRLDLAGVVDKYLGETEKNLDRVLDHVEALDVVLLIDEGDALMARRTHVQSSNDRYANLGTNYLLQRFDSFEGIVVVTTNAEQHLDAAFERRLDVVVDFAAPGPAERLRLWGAHLPACHLVDEETLTDIAVRCALTGGQVRNVVLHACLPAVEEDRPVSTDDLLAAVRREYGKQGALCPLRDRSARRSVRRTGVVVRA